MTQERHMLWTTSFVVFAVFLYLILASYLLCTSPQNDLDNSSEKSIQLTLAVPAGLESGIIYQTHLRQFKKKHPEIVVKLLEISGNYYQKVLVMIAGNVAPDLMWMGQSFGEFADRNVFLDITDRLKLSKLDLREYRPEICNLYVTSGRYYSLPFGIDASFVAYNRKLFREAGIPFPNDDWTYAAFLQAAQQLTRRNTAGQVECYGFRGNLPLEVFGASIFDHATGAVTCNRPEMITYFRTNLELSNQYKVTPTLEENMNMNSDSISYFKQERTAMLLLFTMRWSRAFELLKDMDWGITTTPKVKQHAQWASSQAICIYRNTRHPDAAWQLFKSFQDDDFQLSIASLVIPARNTIAAKTFALRGSNPHNFQVMSKIVKILTPTPRVPHFQELEAAFSRYSGKVFARLLSPEDAMQKCEDEMKRRIAKFNRNEKAFKESGIHER